MWRKGFTERRFALASGQCRVDRTQRGVGNGENVLEHTELAHVKTGLTEFTEKMLRYLYCRQAGDIMYLAICHLNGYSYVPTNCPTLCGRFSTHFCS